MNAGARSVSATLKVENTATVIDIEVTQRSGARSASGRLILGPGDGRRSITATQLGVLQAGDGWASVTGVGIVGDGTEHAFVATIDQHDAPRGMAMLTMAVDGEQPWRGPITLNRITAQ